MGVPVQSLDTCTLRISIESSNSINRFELISGFDMAFSMAKMNFEEALKDNFFWGGLVVIGITLGKFWVQLSAAFKIDM